MFSLSNVLRRRKWLFHDRREAGRRLVDKLRGYEGFEGLVVLALPRGGVPVGYEIARGLGAPLDVFIVRKLGLPGREELAMGALASGGVRVLNQRLVKRLGIPEELIERVATEEGKEIARREREYRGGRPPLSVQGKTVLLIDDGLATGATMRAGVLALRGRAPQEIIVAVPVASADTCEALRSDADDVVCAMTPKPFRAVGLWYEHFEQTSDDEVRELLRAVMGTETATPAAHDRREQA
jgi:predicted phosphoribosyltransferase